MSDRGAMYDDFSADYDRFVDWNSRLSSELPFIEGQLRAVNADRVLDAACGTGRHAISLAERGYEVIGADLSTGMIERARCNAAERGLVVGGADGLDVGFTRAGFGELSTQVGSNFDALLCLGNSLPHSLTPADLATTLADFAGCLRPNGLLLIQNRNFDAVLASHQRWMDPQAHREDGMEWLFVRFYDWQADGTLAFNLATLRRQGDGGWEQRVTSTPLWPLRQGELRRALETEGYRSIVCFGDLQGAPFDANKSPNLVVVARNAESQCLERTHRGSQAIECSGRAHLPSFARCDRTKSPKMPSARQRP